ncbi:MAG: hypothetical protein ACREF7_04550 [Candidatus Saccharimonadales bacterium]
MKRTSSIRNNQGLLADSAVGVLMVMTGMILGAVLLFNIGAFTYYKIKLGFVANKTANYAANLPLTEPSAQIQSDVNKFAGQILQSMGFNPATAQVTIKGTQIMTRPACVVTITCPLSSLLNFKNVIPSQITLSDTAVAAQRYFYFGDGQLVAVFGGTTTVPIVNSTGYIPDDGLPAYIATVKSVFPYIGPRGAASLSTVGTPPQATWPSTIPTSQPSTYSAP